MENSWDFYTEGIIILLQQSGKPKHSLIEVGLHLLFLIHYKSKIAVGSLSLKEKTTTTQD